MARIRSTHPTQWTDAKFLSMSPMARLLTIAVRNEADDQGIFKWKPIELKIRLLPLDNVDMQALLSEMEAADQVRRYEINGAEYGIIRNFTKYQKPKSPNSLYPQPPEFPKSPPPEPPPVSPKQGKVISDGEKGREEDKTLPVVPLRGTRESGTNQRAVGTNPRSLQTNPRAEGTNPRENPDFETFKHVYPRRQGSNPWKPARTSFIKAIAKGADPQKIIAGARSYASSVKAAGKEGTEFVAMASTWLNQERWNDEEPKPNGSSGAGRFDRYCHPGTNKLDWHTFDDEMYARVVRSAKQQDKWPAEFGPIDKIPPDLMDDELRRICERRAH